MSHRIDDQLNRLSSSVGTARSRQSVADPERTAGISVVYFVPGNTFRQDFEGIRTGPWFGKRRTQVAQVSVPPEPMSSKEVVHFLADMLEQAVELAAARILRFKRSGHLSTAEATEVASLAAGEMRRLAG